jgi:pyrophosphatase PpaX
MVIGFDLDGTLIDSLDASARLLTRAASEILGQPVPESLVRSHFGKPEPGILEGVLGPERGQAAYVRYQELFEAECASMSLYSGVIDTLTELYAAGIPLALFTSRGAWATEVILEKHGLRSFFRVVLCGDEVTHVKPHPEGILKICETLGAEPARFLYVGDSPSDIKCADGAGALGYQAVWAKNVEPYGGRQLRAMKELKSVLPKW